MPGLLKHVDSVPFLGKVLGRASRRATTFVVVEPESSGSWSPGATAGSCRFDYWLGDDLVRAHPAVLVTEALQAALAALPGATGFSMAPVRVEASGFFRGHSPETSLPSFWVVDVDGEPGRDDMGVTRGGKLVVSRRVLDRLLEFRIERATLAQYVPD